MGDGGSGGVVGTSMKKQSQMRRAFESGSDLVKSVRNQSNR